MPEGDTISRAASTLRRALAGRIVRRFRSAAGDGAIAGRRIETVESAGKNLLVRFDDGRLLRTHMRMHGSWHLYRPGERWQRPAAFARAVLETDEWTVVCFSAPVVEILRAGEERSHLVLSRLGPDVVGEAFDSGEALARLKGRPELEIGDALLRQEAIAGIGNIWKSETLFRCRIDPFSTVGSLSDAELTRIVSTARKSMSARAGASTELRPTTLSGWAVYRRSGLPCRRCGGAIAMRRQGEDRRSTYYCRACQGVP